MNKLKFGVLLVVCLLAISSAAAMTMAEEKKENINTLDTIRGANSDDNQYVPGEIIVKFKQGVKGGEIANINSKHKAEVLSTSQYADFKRLKIAKGKSVPEMVEVYSKNPNVDYAEPNYIAHALMVPNDPLYSPYQWHLDNAEYGGINMESAWGISIGSSDVVVAVIDTGVAYENYGKYIIAPDLANTRFVDGYDFVNNDNHPNDDNSHGTHVTGTIAQSTNNYKGTAGVAFNTRIMPIKVLNKRGSGTYEMIANGIYFATDNGADVISMSLGGPYPSTILKNALAYAYGKGVTIIAASGNDGAETYSSPAAYDAYVIAVGATRYDETLAYYSSYYNVTNDPVIGQYVDITAPGGDLNVDQNGDGKGDGVLQNTFNPNTRNPRDFGYWFFQGTSMATPHVSGVAALVIANGNADADGDGVTSPDEVRTVLESSAKYKDVSGWDPKYGYGIVDAYAALKWTAILNDPPMADANGPYTGTEDIGVLFNGSASSDPDGDVITYHWDFGDGSTGAGVDPTHAYAAGGTYTVTLIVNDGKTDSLPYTTTADIIGVNDPPVADAGLDQTVSVGETVTFDGSGSYDPDGDAITYHWDFGDGGSTGTGVSPIYIYTAVETYEVTLTVTDGGFTDSDTLLVTVTDEPTNTMHIDSISMNLGERNAGRNIFRHAIATVTIVDASGNLGGAAVFGHWSKATSDIDSGTTNANGEVTIISDEVKNAQIGTTFTFTVDDVVLDGWTYDSGTNVETENSIVV